MIIKNTQGEFVHLHNKIFKAIYSVKNGQIMLQVHMNKFLKIEAFLK